MHVVEQLTTSILIDYVIRTLSRIHQMPMPMVQVHTDILAEVGQPLLILPIGSSVVHCNVYCDL